MGQKVSPVSMRLGVNRDFQANWYADKKDFAKFLNEDIKIRKYLETQLKEAALSKVEILRGKNEVRLNLYVARPGVVLGQEGSNLEVIKKGLKKICVKGEEIKPAPKKSKGILRIEQRLKEKHEKKKSENKLLSFFHQKKSESTST